MLKVGFKNSSSVYTPKSIVKHPDNQKEQKNSGISFKGSRDIILVTQGLTSAVARTKELISISYFLKSLGVKELEIGDNIDLARLLKSTMCRVKSVGFDVPTRIICESRVFEENEEIQKLMKAFKIKNGQEAVISGFTEWDAINDPILYLNTGKDWKKGNGGGTRSKDPMHIIAHETGHWHHCKSYIDNPKGLDKLLDIEIEPYQKEIVRNNLGSYAVNQYDIVAEIFARLVLGDSYKAFPPEIFKLYRIYNGPMPKQKPFIT